MKKIVFSLVLLAYSTPSLSMSLIKRVKNAVTQSDKIPAETIVKAYKNQNIKTAITCFRNFETFWKHLENEANKEEKKLNDYGFFKEKTKKEFDENAKKINHNGTRTSLSTTLIKQLESEIITKDILKNLAIETSDTIESITLIQNAQDDNLQSLGGPVGYLELTSKNYIVLIKLDNKILKNAHL